MPKLKEFTPINQEPEKSNLPAEKSPIEIGPWDEKTEKGLIEIKKPEQIKKEREEKEKEERVEKAKSELKNLLSSGDIKKDNFFYEAAGRFYKDITGEDLEYNARKVSQAEARSLGHRVLSKKEYLNEANIKSAQKWALRGEKDDYLKNLRPEDKKQIETKYGNLDRYIGAQAQVLAERTGLLVSEETVFEMLTRGVEIDKIKKTGWFFKKIKVPALGAKMSKAEFEEWVNKMGSDIKERTNNKGMKELERIIGVGEERAKTRREKHMMEMIQDAVKEEKPKISPEQIEIEKRMQDLSDLRNIKTELSELLEKLVSKRRKTRSSYEEGKIKIVEQSPEPLSDRELDYFKKSGLFDMNETGEVGVRKITAAGKILEKKLEEVTKKRKLGHSFSDEDSEFFSHLKEFVKE